MAMTDQSSVSQIQSQLQNMSLEDKTHLANKMGVGEDFTQA
jgi:hypothetical protein